jgi:hypothetical protein
VSAIRPRPRRPPHRTAASRRIRPALALLILALLAPGVRAAEAAPAGFWAWLLNSRRIDPTDATLQIGWEHPMPTWAWALAFIAAGLLAAISYRRLIGRRLGRVTLALARAAALSLLVMLLAGPKLVLPRENVEEDHVLVLLDRSESMTVKDAPSTPAPPAARITREQQLASALASHPELWNDLAARHHVDWLGFSDRLVEIGDRAKLPEPKGQSSALRTALHQAVRRVAGKPIAGVVVLTDGRSSESIGPDTWRMLNQSGVAVWSVPLGSSTLLADLAIQRVDAPDQAFVNDTVPIAVAVSRVGADPASSDQAPPGTLLKLIDQTTGAILDQKPVTRFGQTVRLLSTPRAAGQATWKVLLVSPDPELIEENNSATLELTLVDRPIRLLLVEGYPRWEYRYLKNMLLRESSIASSVMLISADRTFAQEGTIPLRRLPRTLEEIKPYDVLVIGDVPASFFSAQQIQLMIEQVAQRGAGLLWIAGEQDTPSTYAASPLSTLLPMASTAVSTPLPAPIHLKPTPLAEALGVLRLLSPESSADADAWPTGLPPMLWAQTLGPLKPAAEVLAVDESSNAPLVARMRFGAGQSLYVATDESWRWRYGRGELYMEQYWTQLIRLLARGRLQGGSGADDRARLVLSHRRATTSDTLTVELFIADATLLEKQPPTLEVVVEPDDPTAGAPSETILLNATQAPGEYRAQWQPRRSGKINLRLAAPTLADLRLIQSLQVDRVDDEMRFPAADHALLAELSEKSGGSVVPVDQLPQLLDKIPDRERRTAADISEPLWNTPLAFALLLLLLTAEWIGRKFLGLA